MGWKSALGMSEYTPLEMPVWADAPSYAAPGPRPDKTKYEAARNTIMTVRNSPAGGIVAMASSMTTIGALEASGIDLEDALAWRAPIDEAASMGALLAYVESNTRASRAGSIESTFASIYVMMRTQAVQMAPEGRNQLAGHVFDVAYWTGRTDEAYAFDIGR